MEKADIGMVGLAVMGENLVKNMLSKGYSVAVYNRELEAVTDFVEKKAKGQKVIGTYSYKELAENVKKPRKIMLMIRAGKPVDEVIENIIPYLEEGDIIIDGGNSHFPDTIRRTQYLESKGLLFIGTGVSGGEEGALKGPSMMPGGSLEAWEHVKPIFQSISAKVNGNSCCQWIGENGAGHFVKMVHNGIEYGDMQLICETYHFMKEYLALSTEDMRKIFADWNESELNSYLIEITSNILAVKDTDGQPLVDKILDAAGQKGTGKWTVISSMEEGVPLSLIAEAVYARCLSSIKDERVAASKEYAECKKIDKYDGDKAEFIENLKKALYASKIISYAQGFSLMRTAAKTYNWNLNYGGIALTWRGGCIIRSAFLDKIKEAYQKNPDLENLLLDDYFKTTIKDSVESLRKVVATACLNKIPMPAMSSALSYFDGYTNEVLPANLLQAQRDYFGAHTYERIDAPRGKFFHTNWTGEGGDTASTKYEV
ncbi:MAG TPA: decarboxylating NADP(+)-dependent phosphogluconate dehydrogenase [Clostridiales bacterium]|jgi:6-phosphogluconate dehydrogenase|nr:decarboxylating NADP(+)-dependent phosphogluconate dehydrogenase [Clostridiales bacterium]